jgi:hypothetical protein
MAEPQAETLLPPFLTLPAELKDRIFSYILIWRRPISLTGTRRMFNGLEPWRLNLFKVCKQIHCEATEYFYRNNTFEFDLRPGCMKFLNGSMISNRYLSHMRSVVLLVWDLTRSRPWCTEMTVRQSSSVAE